jgi:serine O-acetyltransferase
MRSSLDLHWNIDAIVSELRTLRVDSLEHRQRRDRPPRLPSRKALVRVLDGLSAALFPNRLGSPELTEESIDYFVGHTLDTALRELFDQLCWELRFSSGQDSFTPALRDRAIGITREFAAGLPAVRTLVDTDIRAAYEGDPAARSVDEVLVCYPGIMAITCQRLAHGLYRLDAPLLARIISEIAHSATGIDIHPGAEIDGSFFIDHGTGVVIGETAIIGRHVRLYQHVTLGAKRFPAGADGTLVKGNARHPIVEDDVVIYAGATLLGRITIGRGSIIGGIVWLTHSVPPGSNITQAQAQSGAAASGA